MSVTEYRKKLLEEIEREAKEHPTFRDFLNEVKSKRAEPESFSSSEDSAEQEDDISEAIAIIRDDREDVEIRITALNGISYEIGRSDELIDLMFELLRTAEEPAELKTAVLRVFQLSEFNSPTFRARRPQYMEMLREIVQNPDKELRQQAIGILAKSKDEYVQRRLFEGLRNEAEALVPPEKAIQLLSYDIHSEFFPVLQEIVKNPPNLLAKNEAVRLLAADADAKNLLTEILLDKNESKRVRQTSAIALQSLAPAEFKEQAEQIIFDDSEYDDIRATCINALEGAPVFSDSPESMTFSDSPESFELTGGDALLEKVEELKETSSSSTLRKVAKRFVSKRKR